MNEVEKLKQELLDSFNKSLEEKTKSFLNVDEIAKVRADFETSIKAMSETQVKAYNEVIEGLKKEVSDITKLSNDVKEIVKNQAEEIDALKAPRVHVARTALDKRQQLEFLIQNAFYSQEFKNFENMGFKNATAKMTIGGKDKLELHRVGETGEKAVIPTSDHTGTVMISEISNVVRDDNPNRMSHVRDILQVSPTNQAQIVAGEVYDFTDALTLGAIITSENGQAPESVFKSREATWTKKRIVNSFRISKDWFLINGLQWVIDKVLSKLPDATFFVEDRQLLFGDGVGSNVKGLTIDAQSFNLAYATFVATAFHSVASYNAGAQSLVTFHAAHGLKNGDNLTIGNATAPRYNATHVAVEVVDAVSVVIDVAYLAEADVSAWTGSGTSIFYHGTETAQEVDALMVADALLNAGEFNCSGHIVNPQQRTQMAMIKDSTGNYLNISKDANGMVVGIGGKPLIATTAMPSGKFLSGDFSRNGVEVRELVPFNIQFAEDTESLQKNEIVLVVEEQIIFPIYNPKWFIYGKFSSAKSQLETPSS